MGFLNFNYIHCMKARLSYQKLYFRTGTHISSSIRVKKKEGYLNHLWALHDKRNQRHLELPTCKKIRPSFKHCLCSNRFINYHPQTYYNCSMVQGYGSHVLLGIHLINSFNEVLWSLTQVCMISSGEIRSMDWSSGHFFFFLLSFYLCHITPKFQEVKRGRSFAFCWQLTHNDSSFTKISVDVTSCHVFRDRVTFRVFRANDLWLCTTIWHEYKKTNVRITQNLTPMQQYSQYTHTH